MHMQHQHPKLIFWMKFFYVMGKVLSGELSCTWAGLDVVIDEL